MNVTQYTFQSPSTNAVQVGKLDPSSVKEEETTTSKPAQQKAAESKTIGEILATPIVDEPEQVTVTQNNILDVYA